MSGVHVGPVTKPGGTGSPRSIEIAAPPPLVYQMLAAIGQGGQPNGERAEILEDLGDELICDFWTSVALPGGRDRLVRTRGRVTLFPPPDRIAYEHLDDPGRGLREEIRVDVGEDLGTRLTYSGVYHPSGTWDRLRATVVARPAIHRVMRSHFADVRVRAEARAARSRVFAAEGKRP